MTASATTLDQVCSQLASRLTGNSVISEKGAKLVELVTRERALETLMGWRYSRWKSGATIVLRAEEDHGAAAEVQSQSSYGIFNSDEDDEESTSQFNVVYLPENEYFEVAAMFDDEWSPLPQIDDSVDVVDGDDEESFGINSARSSFDPRPVMYMPIIEVEKMRPMTPDVIVDSVITSYNVKRVVWTNASEVPVYGLFWFLHLWALAMELLPQDGLRTSTPIWCKFKSDMSGVESIMASIQRGGNSMTMLKVMNMTLDEYSSVALAYLVSWYCEDGKTAKRVISEMTFDNTRALRSAVLIAMARCGEFNFVFDESHLQAAFGKYVGTFAVARDSDHLRHWLPDMFNFVMPSDAFRSVVDIVDLASGIKAPLSECKRQLEDAEEKLESLLRAGPNSSRSRNGGGWGQTATTTVAERVAKWQNDVRLAQSRRDDALLAWNAVAHIDELVEKKATGRQDAVLPKYVEVKGMGSLWHQLWCLALQEYHTGTDAEKIRDVSRFLLTPQARWRTYLFGVASWSLQRHTGVTPCSAVVDKTLRRVFVFMQRKLLLWLFIGNARPSRDMEITQYVHDGDGLILNLFEFAEIAMGALHSQDERMYCLTKYIDVMSAEKTIVACLQAYGESFLAGQIMQKWPIVATYPTWVLKASDWYGGDGNRLANGNIDEARRVRMATANFRGSSLPWVTEILRDYVARNAAEAERANVRYNKVEAMKEELERIRQKVDDSRRAVLEMREREEQQRRTKTRKAEMKENKKIAKELIALLGASTTSTDRRNNTDDDEEPKRQRPRK